MAEARLKKELRALAWPILWLAAALVFAALLLSATSKALEAARDRNDRQRQVLASEQSRVHKAGDEKALIERYREPYILLTKQGFIGDEQRINWVDGLRSANFALKLFGIDYAIGPQAAYGEPYAAVNGLTLRESVMRVSLKLLHEEDLLRFFEYLQSRQLGVFHPRHCVLTRLRAVPDAAGPNLDANCEIAWITAQVSTAAPNSAGVSR